MLTVLLIYGTIIVVSFITGIFVTIYNNKHKQNNASTTSSLKEETIINEPPMIEDNSVEEKTYYDLPVIVSVIDVNEKEASVQ